MAQNDAPHFPPDHESPRRAYGDALVALDTLAELSSRNVHVQPVQVTRIYVEPREHSQASAFFTSVLLHFAVVFFLVRVPLSFFLHHHQSTSLKLPQIVYEFHEIELPKDLPALKPPGPGGKPGKGIHPDELPARGSTAFHPKVTVVSNPPNPDNNLQTIIQPNVPKEVKIKINLKLPNIIMGGTLPIKTPAPPAPPPPMKLSLPSTLHSLTVPQVAVVSPTTPNLIIPASETPNMPAIPMPEPPPPPLVPKLNAEAKETPVVTASGLIGSPDGSSKRLLLLSLNPAPPSSSVSIPAGNRYGAFTISPGGKQPGSPSGVEGGTLNGGVGGPGSGGDNSTGVGSGNRGGGGNGGGTSNLAVSTSGTAANGGSGMGGNLNAAAAAAKLIYPILRPPPKNRFAMVVTAGPVGGGGLHVFGVLNGGKVYTVFLPMPNRNWILQYCTLNPADSPAKSQKNEVNVSMNFGLLPPDVEKRYDFHRPALPAELNHNMIILHGIIDKDGAIENLRIYQSVQVIADQAALAAFKRWKFKPALKDGKPIPVEILVGIPVS